MTETLSFSEAKAGPIDTPPRGLYPVLDRVCGLLLLSMIVLAPWFFGTTEEWSVWVMNVLGYLCGGLLIFKWVFRWRQGVLALDRITQPQDESIQASIWVARCMAFLTVAVLFYILVSALNARATFFPEAERFEYHQNISWLPSTYDSNLTWEALRNYFALALFFWALRDWLAHPPPHEVGNPRGLPPRFQILFWTISLNATLLALIGAFQRLSGTDKLLWFRQSYDGNPELFFGPFAFRGNAAQYLNLSWPVILGFWWAQRLRANETVWDGKKVGGAPHVVLLLFAIVTASGPLIAASDGGTLATAVCLVFVLFIFFVNRNANWRVRCTVLFVALSVLGLGGALGWDQLAPQLRELFKTPYANPNEVYENARKMALDYPLFGIGPGAFRTVYHLYRSDPQQSWQAFVHDDWLETKITFGWAGSMLILILLGMILAKWFLPGGIRVRWEFVAMIWVSLGGCLAYGKFSFPLQVYSILLLFLVFCAVLSSISGPAEPC